MNSKITGTFYTPLSLANYMIQYVFARHEIQTVLEPSVGNGIFLEGLTKQACAIDVVDIDHDALNEISVKCYQNVSIINENYLEYAYACEKKYDLIIGNPPYVRKKYLSAHDREISRTLTDEYELSQTVFQNLWVSFILCSLRLLKEEGTIFFVLPFEFLQVQYPCQLRGELEKRFNTIEIITFEKTPFPELEQDVCLVYLSNISKHDPEIKYKTVDSCEHFVPVKEGQIKRNKPLSKWSNAILVDDEMDMVNRLSALYPTIASLGDTAPGIVTAANKFFILNKEKIHDLNCKEHILPIIKKSSYLRNLLIINEMDFKRLDEDSEDVWFLNLANKSEDQFSSELNEYLLSDVTQNIKSGYKCRHRVKWFWVPVTQRGDLLFFKRYDMIPKLLVNSIDLYTTDLAYNVRIDKEKYDPNSVAFCFYNSLTLLCCEINGRFYGGGVGELTPTEFKSLPLPYQKISKNDVEQLESMFRKGTNYHEITNYVDSIVLKNLTSKELECLRSIRDTYLVRRIYQRRT
ncbi:Modification methylase Eco57IB [Methanocorpusculaceae archaeon Cs1]|uniref:site-specific DNA-methyltransferase (adenine-specific) n=1 Tax=Methanorbis rubei TaxID=3028300 RepID=A0AAE4SCT7_9EURY|nr:Modification methylase Eco57IB [Methanocorpusculaceae archaeon Cs1]